MSQSAQQTEIISCTSSSWTQVDVSPLSPRSYVEIICNDTSQNIGVWYTSGTAPSAQAWNTGEIVLGGDKTAIAPAEATVKIYIKTQTGGMVTGAAIILREWS